MNGIMHSKMTSTMTKSGVKMADFLYSRILRARILTICNIPPNDIFNTHMRCIAENKTENLMTQAICPDSQTFLLQFFEITQAVRQVAPL